MSQLTTGIHAILGNPKMYDVFQNIIGANKFRSIYANEYVALNGTERILDIGCGTARILDYLPATVDYIGFDASSDYIAAAKAHFGERGQFICQYVDEMAIEDMGKFDIVMANGLIHHLNDAEVTNLCRISSIALRDGGRMVTHDPCFSNMQSRLADYIISRDRGQNVRFGEGYAALLHPFFREVNLNIRHDMLNIPYNHAIIIGRK